jgi:predicted Zn-dependent peptidase
MLHRDQLVPHIQRTTWPSGMRLLTEEVPGALTASVGLWIVSGSRDERPDQQGITHLIEHMLFKGTAEKDAQTLALEMNALGGHFNAYTSQENVCLHARVIADHLPRATSLLIDLFRRSVFADEELERERSVVLEEIKMTNDTPDELIHDLFHEELWGEHGLGRSILGTEQSVLSVRRDDLFSHVSREFTPSRLLFAAAGAVDVDALERQIEELVGDLEGNANGNGAQSPPVARFGRRHISRRLEQTHFCFGTLAPVRAAEDRHAFALVNSILGGGGSSRIFQEVREKRGLAYSVGTFVAPYADAGCFGVSGGTSPNHLPEVFKRSIAEIERICQEAVPRDELDNAKEQMRAHLVLGLESTHHRMSRLAELEIHFGRFIPLEETMARLESLTPEDLLRAAGAHLSGAEMAVVTIGPGSNPLKAA